MSPVLEKVASQRTDVSFGKVNVDDCQNLSSKYRVSALPTLVIFKDGQRVGNIIGLVSESNIIKELERVNNV